VARRGGLGKGLGALIPPGGTEGVTETAGLDELPLASIRPNRFQPRDHFDEEALSLLADSIRAVGVLQPVLVRPTGEDIGEEYELIAGERRWRAARRVGLQTIPALVRETDDAAALEQALVENLHRDSLNPLEEAAAYQQLIEDFGLTHDDVAARVGRSRTTVTNTLRLMQLPPAIQKLLQQGKLSAGHSRALLGTPDRSFQEVLAKRIVEEDLSVRSVEEAVREHQGDAKPNGTTGTPSEDGIDAARRPLRPPGLLELEELLGDHLETRVKISMGSARGKVVVEFSTLEDLERIYRLMTDGVTAPG
jgi:ParB family transcriptional regulator, chromosome partitioning protein